jgi:hypothetical protein
LLYVLAEDDPGKSKAKAKAKAKASNSPRQTGMKWLGEKALC